MTKLPLSKRISERVNAALIKIEIKRNGVTHKGWSIVARTVVLLLAVIPMYLMFFALYFIPGTAHLLGLIVAYLIAWAIPRNYKYLFDLRVRDTSP